MGIKVGFISLGCAKNQVDAEVMLAHLKKRGHILVDDVAHADVAVINTCGFIDDAKQEAIDNILEVCTLKNEGRIKGVVVCGCLAERYKEELLKEIPDVDAVFGVADKTLIVPAVEQAYENQPFCRFVELEQLRDGGDRIQSTPFYTAYLKIAEGCDNRCAYCVIPSLRGGYRSRPFEELVEEAKWLCEGGVRELVIIAQDITRYGTDLYGKHRLAELLQELCKIQGLRWIRLLYLYPDEITEELLDTIAREEKVLPYIDLPLQHASDSVLKRMNRRGDSGYLRELISRLRKKLPELVLRTTFIVGFPGETEEEFRELYDFVKEISFDRVGVFTYSQEEGTPASLLPGQVPDEVKEHRREVLLDLASMQAQERNENLQGQEVTVLVEGYDRVAECWFGRTWADAPEVDGKVFFTARKKPVEGSFIQVLVTEVVDYDLFGEQVEA